jgi:hypothetical protein
MNGEACFPMIDVWLCGCGIRFGSPSTMPHGITNIYCILVPTHCAWKSWLFRSIGFQPAAFLSSAADSDMLAARHSAALQLRAHVIITGTNYLWARVLRAPPFLSLLPIPSSLCYIS